MLLCCMCPAASIEAKAGMHAHAGEVLVNSTGTKVGPAMWVGCNRAYFAVPSIAGAGYTASDLDVGVFPNFSTEGYNESFTSFGS